MRVPYRLRGTAHCVHSAGSYYFLIVVVIIRYEPAAAARWAFLFIIRTFFNNAFTITVWTRFLCHVDASARRYCVTRTLPPKEKPDTIHLANPLYAA